LEIITFQDMYGSHLDHEFEAFSGGLDIYEGTTEMSFRIHPKILANSLKEC